VPTADVIDYWCGLGSAAACVCINEVSDLGHLYINPGVAEEGGAEKVKS